MTSKIYLYWQHLKERKITEPVIWTREHFLNSAVLFPNTRSVFTQWRAIKQMENSECNRTSNLTIFTAYLLLLYLGDRGSIRGRCQKFIFSPNGPVGLWGLSSPPPYCVKLTTYRHVVPRIRMICAASPLLLVPRLHRDNFILLIRHIHRPVKSEVAICCVEVKVKVKFLLYTPWRHMDVIEVELHSF